MAERNAALFRFFTFYFCRSYSCTFH
ncbi:hypothetical protein [Leptospira inadai]